MNIDKLFEALTHAEKRELQGKVNEYFANPVPDESLEEHLSHWAPGNLQSHLLHDHKVLEPTPYDGPLNEIHKKAHEDEAQIIATSEKTPAEHLCDFLNHEHSPYEFGVSPGGVKYTRVVRSPDTKNATVYCFVNASGQIFKASGWKAPASGVRSTVVDVLDRTVETDVHGGWLYK